MVGLYYNYMMRSVYEFLLAVDTQYSKSTCNLYVYSKNWLNNSIFCWVIKRAGLISQAYSPVESLIHKLR